MMSDKLLEEKLLKMLEKLERKVDWIGPTPLRRQLNEHVIKMRIAIRDFDQEAYESDEDWYSRPENERFAR